MTDTASQNSQDFASDVRALRHDLSRFFVGIGGIDPALKSLKTPTPTPGGSPMTDTPTPLTTEAALAAILAEMRKSNEALTHFGVSMSRVARALERRGVDGVPVSGREQPAAKPAAKPGLYDSVARIEISLDSQGRTWMKAYFNGHFDSTYGNCSDERLLGVELPKLLAELREQIQESLGSSVTS